MSLRQKLKVGHSPLITVELSPPKGADPSRLLALAASLKGKVDAVNLPDCQLSMLRMSSLAAAKLIQDQVGIEAIWQLTCRDRNLIALQSDLLGAYALGLKNVLALTGDPVQIGDQKDHAKQVFHLESVRLLDLIQTLNEGKDACGGELKAAAPQFTVGAAINPFKLGNRAQQLRLRQKLERQIDFFQTQPVYHLAQVQEMQALLKDLSDALGVRPPKVILGIIPPFSAQAARRMNREIVGVNIPESFIELLDRAEKPALESIRYCIDVIASFKGVADGFHIMPIGMPSKVGLLLDACFSISPA